MELDKSADPPQAIWVSTTKSFVNKWVSYITTIQIVLFLKQMFIKFCNYSASI